MKLRMVYVDNEKYGAKRYEIPMFWGHEALLFRTSFGQNLLQHLNRGMCQEQMHRVEYRMGSFRIINGMKGT